MDEREATSHLKEDLATKEKACKEALEGREAAQKELEELQTVFDHQKTAYESLLDKLASSETVHSMAQEENDDLKQQLKDLETEMKTVQEESSSQGGKRVSIGGHLSRNSIGSEGDEYSSVQEMKEHLKHTR
mmetsp:Transcript_30593/g.46923  ORF Transcript_30593/g.46923 Transcript_30593/m.46923 type:complete len:132 (+) Transcript_30593:6040-6435(+)